MKIEDFKNRHAGRRCFVLGSGPSLASMDLAGLRDEITFSCNRGYLLFEKLGFPTKYWAIEDALDALQYGKDLPEFPATIRFVPEDIASCVAGEHVPTPFVRGPVQYPTFSHEPPFQWGGTVVHLMIQIAAYMGCGPIYLLGNDFSWSENTVVNGEWKTARDVDHFDENYWPKGFRSYPPDPVVMRRAFVAANRALSQRVVNLTPGSKLDVFERLGYDEVLHGTVQPRPHMEQHEEEIRALAELVGQPRNVLEIGVRAGGTCALWHDLADGMVIGVDKTPNQLADRFPRFKSVVGDSHVGKTLREVETLLGDEMVDLLFIDGDHSLRGTLNDYEMYKHLVTPGGTIAFHDINAAPEHFEEWEEGGSPRFWRELQAEPKGEITVNASWGGIGVVTA